MCKPRQVGLWTPCLLQCVMSVLHHLFHVGFNAVGTLFLPFSNVDMAVLLTESLM